MPLLEGASNHRRAVARAVTFVAAALAFALAHARLGYWTIDDAGITYAYGINLANSGSLGPNRESMPVEGYSNPLLFWLVALLDLLSLFDPMTTHVTLDTIVFGGTCVVVLETLWASVTPWAALTGVAAYAAAELSTGANWLWTASGLENGLVILGIAVLLWRTERASRLPATHLDGVLLAVVATTRPEAPLYSLVAYLFMGAQAVRRGEDARFARGHARATLTAAALGLAFLAWRYLAYGDLLPNTYYAKLGSHRRGVWTNLRRYVAGQLLPHGLAFWASCLALGGHGRARGPVAVLLGLSAASLALPLTAGSDWMGEHRFGTAFFATAHMAYAVAVAFAASGIEVRSARRAGPLLPLAAVVAPALVSFYTSNVDTLVPSDVTLGRVFYLHGGRRLDHQRRLGVINPVVVVPDAGGALLMGAMQIVDSGFLTDYHMARLHRDMRLVNQYQLEERGADMADTNPNWVFDRSNIGPKFFGNPSHMWARRDLVEACSPRPGAPLLEGEGVEVFLTEDDVAFASPGALLRIAVLVRSREPESLAELSLVATTAAGDSDTLSLERYAPSPAPAECRALLVGAPAAGDASIAISLTRKERVVAAATYPVKVSASAEEATAEAETLTARDPEAAMVLMTRLREQLVPRLAHVDFVSTMKELEAADRVSSAKLKPLVEKLRWDGRTVETKDLPRGVQAIEARVVSAYLQRALDESGGPLAEKVLAYGLAVDRLRRFGYFGTAKASAAGNELLRTGKERLSEMPPADRYRALVGLSLARPEDVSIQKRLYRARLSLPELPKLRTPKATRAEASGS